MFAMAPSSAGAIAFLFVAFVVVVFVVAYWRVFVKAGEPGWGAVVPLYNMYLYCKIAGRPEWWLILLFVPLVNIVFALILAMDIAKAFARTPAFGIGLWLCSFIFVPILAFGPAQYTRPASVRA